MKSIFCFGEILLRMSPALNGEWIRQAVMPVHIGGAELNVASALATWNMPVQYCSAAPDNYLTREIITSLHQKNIDTSPFIFSGSRIGIYLLPQGTDLKHAGVIYDRAHSSFSVLQPGMIDWDALLKDAGWFHFSAISPALNENVAMVCKEALEAAARLGLFISTDLNYRSKLWQYGKEPSAIMPALVAHCELVMGNIWSAGSLLNIAVDDHIHSKKSKLAYTEHAAATSGAIIQQFPKCKTVANTFRFDAGEGVQYYATLNEGREQYISKEYILDKVIDKVGSGDCFMAGIIYGKYRQHTPQDTIDFAAAAATGKMMEQGDATHQSIDMIRKRMTA